MSKITEKIFKGEEHYVTSKFGPRTPIKTKYGYTSNFHKGTDYGTNGKRIEQYALEDGIALEVGKNNSVGNYIWIEYPRLKVKMCHYHLDKICVKKGQTVDNNTLIGYTGTTGMSTGIHLHLGIYDLSENEYIDPEVYAQSYIESIKEENIENNTQIIHFNVGNKVILNKDSTEYQHASKGVKIPTTIKNKEYTIKQIDNDCVLLAEINSWVLASECMLKEEYTDYTIKKGDTLWGISQKYNTSVDELVKLNKIKNANIIITGQVIKIPR